LRISGIEIKNFRSIKNQKIKISPITVLYGHNSAGKSSLIYSLLVLRNIILNPNQQSLAFFNLNFVNLGDYKKVVFDHKEKNIIEFIIDIETENVILKYGVSIHDKKGKFILDMAELDDAYEYLFKIDVTFPYPLNIEDKKVLNYEGNKFNASWNGITAQITAETTGSKSSETADSMMNMLNSPIRILNRIDFVPLGRGFHKFSYSPVGLSPNITTEDEVATVIINDPYLEGKLSTYLERIVDREFRRRIAPGTAMASLLTVEKPLGLTVDVVNDGFGVNQVIFLLAKCLRNDVELICIEEPEIHLHPTAIRRLVHTIVDIAHDESKNFIISTHSESFIVALLSLVSKGKLDPNEISFYLVKKERKETTFEYQTVNEDGEIDGGLTSLMESEIEDLKEFLKIRDK